MACGGETVHPAVGEKEGTDSERLGVVRNETMRRGADRLRVFEFAPGRIQQLVVSRPADEFTLQLIE